MVSEVGRDYRQTQSAVGCVKGRACEWTTRPQDHYPWYEEAFEAYQANPAREKVPALRRKRPSPLLGPFAVKGIAWLDELRGEPTVLIHEETAAARGIQSGDTVRVFNDHGYVVLKAVVN